MIIAIINNNTWFIHPFQSLILANQMKNHKNLKRSTGEKVELDIKSHGCQTAEPVWDSKNPFQVTLEQWL